MVAVSKKVLHILSAYFETNELTFEGMSRHGGAERYVTMLAYVVSQRLDTTLLTFGEINKTFTYNTLKIIVLKTKRNRLLHNEGKSYLKFFNLVKIYRKYDVIHAHHYFMDATMIAAIYSKISRKKFYVTDHGGRGINFARYFPAKFFTTKFMGQTEYEQRRFNIKSSRFIKIYGGVDLTTHKPKYTKKNQVVFVGRLLKHKGIEYLIQGIPDGTLCVIAGHAYDKAYYEHLKSLANNNVCFIVSASDDQIIKLLQESVALILPSVDRDYFGTRHENPELFGLVVAEAFACGTPAIVSNSSALAYVVKNDKTGYVVPQNSSDAIKTAISKLLDNTSQAEILGRNAHKEAVQNYNWDSVALKCVNEYIS